MGTKNPLNNSYSIPSLDVSLVRKDDDSWTYSGPAAYGPKAVRESGRGPYWWGDTDEKHVRDFITRATKLGYEIR